VDLVMHHTDADPQLLRTAISAGILRAGRARISTLSALLATPDPDERRSVLRHARSGTPALPPLDYRPPVR